VKITGIERIVCQHCGGTGKDTAIGTVAKLPDCGDCGGAGELTILLSDVKSIKVKTVEVENCGKCPAGQSAAVPCDLFIEFYNSKTADTVCPNPIARDNFIRRVLEQAIGAAG